MASHPTVVNLKARELLKQHPNLPSRTAGRMLLQKYPGIYRSIIHATGVVKYVRGLNGVRSRKSSSKCADPQLIRPPGWLDDMGWQKPEMPETLAERRKDFVLSKGRVMLLSDIHIPYHDKAALELAVAHGRKLKPDVVYLNGDVADFYAVSDHDKDPSRSFKHELDMVRQFLFWLRGQFPQARIIYKTGNHEYRMERYLRKNAPVLLGMTEFHLPKLLRFEHMGIEHVESLQVCRMGKLPVLHGHELAKGGGVNPARWLWLKLDETAFCGHFHSTSEHIAATGLKKKILNCWSVGCLCDLTPDYALTNRWNHGFAEIEIASGGDFEVTNRKVIHHKIY